MRVIFAVKYSGDEYIGLMRISSILRNKGYQVEAVEAEYNKVKERLKDGLPTVLAYSAPTIFVSHYLKLNKRIKERFNVFSVFGGPHPTAVPEMIKEDGVDGVCIGEGEFAMLELVDNLCSGRPVNDIKNWWIKENGKVFKNPLRPLIKDLDSLPFPDRELFKNHALFDRERIYILTGRGCPYACSFCFNPYYNKIYEGQMTSIRKRSVENVIEEIRRFKKDFPLKFVRFYDDIFILPFGWLKEFSSKYKKYVNLPFYCNVRADLIDSRIARYLKNAGCFSVSMGLETADDTLRNEILNKEITKEQIISAVKLLKEQKIRVRTSNILALSKQSIDKDFDTLRLNIKCRVDYASVSMLAFYPKTGVQKSIGKYKHSLLWGLENNQEKSLVERLYYLFPITVEYPFLFPLVKILVRLPLGCLYRVSYLLWQGYCAYFRTYPGGIRAFIKGVKKYTKKIVFLRKERYNNA